MFNIENIFNLYDRQLNDLCKKIKFSGRYSFFLYSKKDGLFPNEYQIPQIALNMLKDMVKKNKVYIDQATTSGDRSIVLHALKFIEQYVGVIRYLDKSTTTTTLELFDYVVCEFLRSINLSTGKDNLIQEAGEKYLSALAVDQDATIYSSFNLGISNHLNMISNMKYEKAETSSGIIILPHKFDGSDITPVSLSECLDVSLNLPIHLDNYRLFRKLSEVSRSGLHLICSANNIIWGFASSLEKPFPKNTLLVEVLGSYHWRVKRYLSNKFHSIFVCKDNTYMYPEAPITKEMVENAIEKEIGSVGTDISELWSFIEEATTEKHGTMIVISDKAESTASRLRNCSIGISQLKLNHEYRSLCSIDGAILCDYNGLCYAIGVILDGEHILGNGETIERGARHNSAWRFYAWCKENPDKRGRCVIVIVSEDGDITLVPKQCQTNE